MAHPHGFIANQKPAVSSIDELMGALMGHADYLADLSQRHRLGA